MTRDEMITQLQAEVKGLTSSLETDDYGNAIDSAERDTGWSLPQTAAFKIQWLLDRSKRHLFFFLMTEAASKFRFKNIYLNHRFEHYIKVIGMMDENFAKAQEEYAYEFAGVSAYELAGTKIDAGFASNHQTGEDMTYSDYNQVIITPNENS